MDIATFKIRHPEFNQGTYSDDQIQVALDDAGLEVDQSKWGARYDRGVALLAAHFLYQSAKESAMPLQTFTVDGITTTFDTSANTGDSLSASKYGMEFSRIRKLVCPGGFVVST